MTRIRTTHTGSLPRPPEILEAVRAHFSTGEPMNEEVLASAVAEIVRKQVEAGIDIITDGEMSKPSFFHYLAERLGGFEPRAPQKASPLGPVDPNGRDALMFPDYYRGMLEHSPFANTIRVTPRVCVGPVKYVGRKFVERDIANLKRAMAAAGAKEAFMPAASPLPFMPNEHYKSDEEYFEAYGEVMREEYKAILGAGFYLQIDDPRMVSNWDSHKEMDLKQYRAWMQKRIAHLNHALRGLPAEQIRYHTCYGVNFGPRLSDLQLEDVLDLIFTINVGAYSFEAANPRHDHEWRVLGRVALPAGKRLIPGAITHSNVTVEHPEVVADRIERWAKAAGPQNVLFGNDCGFSSTAGNTEIPESVAWAKLRALAEGARIASRRL
ncbi:MAG TPA: cobalamin-independent methionine synthase II family protein [Burkholderiales bacterium]|nr:cobalamin-independent methionine synthase II family protein [Burkholderiales bacterium]